MGGVIVNHVRVGRLHLGDTATIKESWCEDLAHGEIHDEEKELTELKFDVLS